MSANYKKWKSLKSRATNKKVVRENGNSVIVNSTNKSTTNKIRSDSPTATFGIKLNER